MGGVGDIWRSEAGDLFARIGSFLADHRLSPQPEHYAFAHGVLSRPESPLARAVDRLTDDGVRLTGASIAALGGTVVSDAPTPGAVAESAAAADRAVADERIAADHRAERLVAETQAQVDGFADMMRAMQDETRGFGRDLAQSAAAIGRVRPAHGVDPGVHDVARIAGAMVDRVRESEAKLVQATREADALRAKLVEAREAARRDPLTGLANRLAFGEAFAGRDAAAPCCVALCDIDRFKRVNDEHGHGVGDRVLKAIAAHLSDACDGHLVARHGGEEFAILLTGVDLARATALLDTARGEIAAKRMRERTSGVSLGPITVSMGVTAVATGARLDEAFERADRLLYAAKTSGRDQVCAQ